MDRIYYSDDSIVDRVSTRGIYMPDIYAAYIYHVTERPPDVAIRQASCRLFLLTFFLTRRGVFLDDVPVSEARVLVVKVCVSYLAWT